MSPGRTLEELAGATGLEPATSCVTGRRSNQLNYAPAVGVTMRSLLYLGVPSVALQYPKLP